MPTLSHTYAINDEIWVVDPSGPAVFHGTIIEIVLDHFYDNTNTLADRVIYSILLDNDKGTMKSTEDYMRLLQADILTLLASIVDSNVC